MALTVLANGTVTLTGSGTEDSLYSNTTVGVFVPNIDLSAMVNGDVIRIRIYKYDAAAGTLRTVFDCEYANIQNDTFKQAPMIDSAYGFKFSATQVTGTGKACKWFITQLDA